MIAGIVALALTFTGIALVAIGVWVSLADRRRAIRKEPKVEAEGAAGETLEGLAKLAEALREHPLGMQLILIGVALMLIGGASGGVAALASS